MTILTKKNRKFKFEIDLHPWIGAGIAVENYSQTRGVIIALPVIVFTLSVYKTNNESNS